MEALCLSIVPTKDGLWLSSPTLGWVPASKNKIGHIVFDLACLHETYGNTPHSSFYGETPPHVPHAKHGLSESDAALNELISHIEAVSSPAVHQEPEATNVQKQQPSAKSDEHVPNSDSKKSVRFSLRRVFSDSRSDPAKSC